MGEEVTDQNKYSDYLCDLGTLIKEAALGAKKERLSSQGKEDEDLKTGVLMGFHCVVSLMQQQAGAFGISLSEINLDDLDENDLL